MNSFASIVFLAFVVGTFAASFEDCSGRGAYGKLKSFNLSPSPLVVRTGKVLKVSFNIDVARKFPENVDIKLNIERKILWGHVGICGVLSTATGGDICTQKLNCKTIQDLQKNNPVQYPCPMPIGYYSKSFDVKIPKFDAGKLGSILGGGTYRATVEIRSGNTLLACARVSDLEIQL